METLTDKIEHKIITDVVNFYMNTLSTKKTINKFAPILEDYKYGFKDNGFVKNDSVDESLKIYHDLKTILSTVCEVYRINELRIKSDFRLTKEVKARIAYGNLALKYNGSTFEAIAKEVNKDRSTFYYWRNEHQRLKAAEHKSNLKAKDYEKAIDYIERFRIAENILIDEFKIQNKIDLCHTEQQ